MFKVFNLGIKFEELRERVTVLSHSAIISDKKNSCFSRNSISRWHLKPGEHFFLQYNLMCYWPQVSSYSTENKFVRL